ncbi:MAG: ferritin-like domain-containing protein [Myxococcaceae bacterium]|nr:ferritin-like domain-containing protein [Myxococcaceae bacterium]
MKTFSLDVLGGPWTRRLAARREGLEVDWGHLAHEANAEQVATAREVWTRTAFSEYASGACFAEISSALLAANAPIDLVAAAGEFVADEMFHAELAARVATALGGAVPLEVDVTKLVRPARSAKPLVRAAELIVRTCCVGEALTVPMLNQSRRAAGSKGIEAVITRILRDESQHAQLGWWFFDWAELHDGEREVLGRLAGETLRAFTVLFAGECRRTSGLGALDCAKFDGEFLRAVREEVVGPLAERGIVVPLHDVEELIAAAA